MKKLYIFIIGCFILLLVIGCSDKNKTAEIEPITPDINIPAEPDKANDAIEHILTTEKKIALTFNGLAEEAVMLNILNELDDLNIKATFFLDGMSVAEEPELANEILSRGHSVQNNTLNHVLPDNLTYKAAYIELKLANDVFSNHLNITPQYARTRSGDSSVSFEKAAAALGMDVITYTINPKDSDMKSAEEIVSYVSKHATRGAIVELNTYINPEVIRSLKLMQKKLKKNGYTLTSLEDVQATSYLSNKKPKTNKLAIDKSEQKPVIIENFNTADKEVVLTFGGWSDEQIVEQILNILDEYDVKASFFVIGKGIETNPSLARLMFEHGHDVASHSYNYEVTTEMKTKKLQKDVINNDKLLANVLQEKPLNYFRPAQGIIDRKSAKTVASLGVDYIVLYDVNSFDWDLSRTEDYIYKHVVNQVKPGSIINMHMNEDSHVIHVLPRIIEALQRKDYSFKKVSEMIERHSEGAK